MVTRGDAINALWHAHVDVIGGYCPVARLHMLAAQSALETAYWRAMHGFNFGNIRGSGDAGSQSIAGATEIIDGVELVIPGGFAAYSSATEGARAFVRFLGVASHPPKPNRYAAAWDAAARGDIDAYSHALRAAGYYTANEALYTQGLHAAWAALQPDIDNFIAAQQKAADGI